MWSNLDTRSVEIISKWIHMNRPPYHIHVVAIQVLGICLMFFNECFFKNSELKNFFFTKIKDFFLSHFMSYYLHSAIENLYLRNAPTYANYDIPKKIFSDIFFFFGNLLPKHYPNAIWYDENNTFNKRGELWYDIWERFGSIIVLQASVFNNNV